MGLPAILVFHLVLPIQKISSVTCLKKLMRVAVLIFALRKPSHVGRWRSQAGACHDLVYCCARMRSALLSSY